MTELEMERFLEDLEEATANNQFWPLLAAWGTWGTLVSRVKPPQTLRRGQAASMR
jgi:hypothetical protein